MILFTKRVVSLARVTEPRALTAHESLRYMHIVRLKKNTGLLELKITFLQLITILHSHASRHFIRVVSSGRVFFPS